MVFNRQSGERQMLIKNILLNLCRRKRLLQYFAKFCLNKYPRKGITFISFLALCLFLYFFLPL